MPAPRFTPTPPSDAVLNTSTDQNQTPPTTILHGVNPSHIASNSIVTSANLAPFHNSTYIDSTNLWNQISALQQSLECKICDSTLKNTVTLPCGHLFCLKCIQNLSKRKCPMCYVDYPKRSVANVPQVDAAVQRMNALVGLVGDLMTPSRMTPRVVSRTALNGSMNGHNVTNAQNNLSHLHTETPLTLRHERNQKRIQNMDVEHLKAEIQRIEDWIRIKVNERQQVRQCIEVIRTQGLSALNEEKWPILSYLRSRHSSPSRALDFASWNAPNMSTNGDVSMLHQSMNTTTNFNSDLHLDRKTLNQKAMEIVEYSGMYSKYDKNDVVIITTGLDDDDKHLVEQAMTFNGGHVVSEFSPDVTHVVTAITPQGTAKRTVKYACGVLHGCWIVSIDWIVESLHNERWLNEKCFEVAGDTKDLGAPAKGRERRLTNKPPIFQGVKVLFCGDFSSPYPPQEDLELISETGGAQLIRDVTTEYNRATDSLLLIVGRMTPAAREEVENNLGVRGVHYSWLLDSCSHYRALPVHEYELARGRWAQRG